MPDEPQTPAETQDPAPQGLPVTPQGAAPAETTPPAARKSLEDSLSGLDDETKAYVLGEVAKARREAGSARTTARQQAAEQARNELAQQIGKAIGLVADETPDPAALTQQLASQSADARTAKLELAVYRAASELGGDASALLDSRSFMQSVTDVDPGDAAAVRTAISTALEANAALRNTPARRLPAPNPAVGSSAAGAPSIDDAIAAAKKAGDVKTWMHLENQKLAAPSR